MIQIKNIYLTAAMIFSGALTAQGTSAVSHYPQMYENQAASANAAENMVLSAKEQIDVNINRLAGDPVLRNAHWGFVIYDPKTKKIINSYNENSSFVPASTTKLLTTETALAILGSKFRWSTQLEYSGNVDTDGILNGNLYIIGSGDPSLGTGKAGSSRYTEIISDFIYSLSNKGIKKINGDIIIQTAVFKENKLPTLPENVVWMEQNNYYLPVGSTQNIEPRNEQLIVKKASPFDESKRYFYVSPYINKLVFADKFAGSPVNTKIPDPPAYLANNLRASLIKSGIPVSGKVITKIADLAPENRQIITAYKSPALIDIVTDTNHRSDNALAEALLRVVGFQKAGDQTLESGRMVVNQHLREKNFDMNGFSFMDGSGLSKSNMVTPIAQVKFLTALMSEPYYKDFFESLPVAGQSGTLKKMFFGNAYGQIFAKTGTLNKVKTLAGYIKTRSGRTLAFSLLINNYSGSVDQVKARMEELLNPTLEL